MGGFLPSAPPPHTPPSWARDVMGVRCDITQPMRWGRGSLEEGHPGVRDRRPDCNSPVTDGNEKGAWGALETHRHSGRKITIPQGGIKSPQTTCCQSLVEKTKDRNGPTRPRERPCTARAPHASTGLWAKPCSRFPHSPLPWPEHLGTAVVGGRGHRGVKCLPLVCANVLIRGLLQNTQLQSLLCPAELISTCKVLLELYYCKRRLRK